MNGGMTFNSRELTGRQVGILTPKGVSLMPGRDLGKKLLGSLLPGSKGGQEALILHPTVPLAGDAESVYHN